MNICIFSPGAFAKYGHSYDYCKGLANACEKKGIDIMVFGYDGPLQFNSKNIKEKRIYGTGSNNKNTSFFNKIKWGYNRVLSFNQLLDQFNSYIQDFGENTFVIFETFEYLSLAYKIRQFKFSFCCILHDTNFNFKQANIIAGAYKFFCRSAVKKITRNSNQIFVHGKGMKSNLINQIGKNYSPKIKVLPYGSPDPFRITKEDQISSRKKLGLNENKKYVLSFGTLRQDKNFLEIFEALTEQDEWEWLISGPEGDLSYDYILQKSKEYNLKDKIHIHNRFIENNEQHIFFGACDVVVNLYKEYIRHESGTAQLARTFLKPLIVSGPPDLINYVEEFNIGWIVDQNRSLKSVLLKYINETKVDRHKMEKNIFILAKKNSWDSVLNIILKSNEK